MSDASPDLPASPPVLAPAAPPPGEPPLPFWARVSDRLNPILVRETQQAVNGRTFLTALSLALGAIVLVALTTAGAGGSTRAEGWSAFALGMQVLVPILCLVVPLQAFLSTRHEVSTGTVEHLLLSRLTPGAVVRGKIAAAAVESVVFLSVFAPLIALTYLLRGVDVPTIALALGLAFVYGMGAVVFAVAMGAVCRWPGLRALPLVVVALGLTIGTGALTLGMRPVLAGVGYTLRTADMGFGRGAVSLVMPVLLTAPFLFLLASAALAHPHENRSTPFRVFALVALLGTATWAQWFDLARTLSFGGRTGNAAGGVLTLGAMLTTPFWLFAVTEEEALSPRVRTLVPRRTLLALLAVPFLPGGGRGLLFTLLLAGLAFAGCFAIPALVGAMPPDPETVERCTKAWGYVLLYASLAKLLRNLMPAGGRSGGVLRAGFPVVVAFIALIPAVLRLLAGNGTTGDLPLAGLNPFAALSGTGSAADWVMVAAPIAVLGHVLSMTRGVREVLGAAADRRARAA